jgi:repressor LexA
MPRSAARFAFRLPFAHDRGVLTRRQKQLLDYLRRYLDAHGYAPTLAEIGRHLRLGSVATVHKHLRNLERRGLIRRLPHRSRALELVAETRAVAVPLLGEVAAGAPIEPVEVRETVALPEALLGRGETFALRVRGDSMVGDGILDGDLIVVEARPDAPDGATVVALVDGEATVKRLYRERGGRVRLVPANERLAPIVAAADRVQVRGVVIGLLRRYR